MFRVDPEVHRKAALAAELSGKGLVGRRSSWSRGGVNEDAAHRSVEIVGNELPAQRGGTLATKLTAGYA